MYKQLQSDNVCLSCFKRFRTFSMASVSRFCSYLLPLGRMCLNYRIKGRLSRFLSTASRSCDPRIGMPDLFLGRLVCFCFVCVLFHSKYVHLRLRSHSVALSILFLLFIWAKCSWQHSCMSYTFSISHTEGACFSLEARCRTLPKYKCDKI